MELQIMLAAIFIMALVSWLLVGFSKSSKYKPPPGPRGLRFIGNIHQFGKDYHLKLSEWAKEHGSIFSIYFGPKLAIVVNDANLAKDFFSHPHTAGRFITPTILLVTRGRYGVANNDGEAWSELKGFTQQNLAKHGFNKMSALESIFMSGVEQVINRVIREMQTSTAIHPTPVLEAFVANSIKSLLTGEEMDVSDTKMAKFLDDLMTAVQNTVKTGLMFLPWLKHIAPVASGYSALDGIAAEFHAMCQRLVEKRKVTYSPGAPKDFIEAYLDKLATVIEPSSSFFGSTGETNAISSLVELFVGGTESTSQTLSWLILYLSHYHEVQGKLHAEIDNVIGKSRDPSLSDRSRMPYTESTILETLRISSLAPVSVLHVLLEDLRFQEYFIPKGAILMNNLYHIHNDPKVWGDPKSFRPERFLDKAGTTVINRELIQPFQAGRRTCVGESYARNVLFLFTVKLFQTLEVLRTQMSLRQIFTPMSG